LTVNAVLTTISVTPGSASVPVGGMLAFNAAASDQFGAVLGAQPAFTWAATGGGTVNTSGLFVAGNTVGGPFTLTATSAGKSGTASVMVTAADAPTVATPASASPADVTAKSCDLS